MRTRAGSIAVLGAAAVIGAGAFLLPAVASPHATTHTLKFTAVTEKSANFSRNSGAQQEMDVNGKGKIIGFDNVYFQFNPKTNRAFGGVTLDTKGGFLYGTLDLNTNGPVIHGRVTGGTGKFKDASGTIVGRQLNKSGTRTAVTVRYH
jgi:hypothetical protein